MLTTTIGSLARSTCFDGFCELPPQAVKPVFRQKPVTSENKHLPDMLWGLPGLAFGSATQQAISKNFAFKALDSVKIAQTSMYLPAAVKRQQYLNFNHPMYALVRLATLYQQYHGPLLAYLGASALGAVLSSMLQGVQETWVRQQETAIRQQLIIDLQGSVAQSLKTKYQFDDAMKMQTQKRIISALKTTGVNPEKYQLGVVSEGPLIPYQPSQPTSRKRRFGQDKLAKPAQDILPILPIAWAGLGAVTGVLINQMAHWLRNQRHVLPIAQQEVMECLVTADMESAFLLRHKGMLAGVFGLSALAKMSQLLLNASREVAVTQKNAETERRYQQANWQTLDPQFHAIAENAALEAEWRQFTRDLPLLKQQPDQLQARINALIDNRGKASPPGYYLATPPVMLSEAKS